MKLFSYVVRLDFGFAPNPFYGVCTLATCKGQIRRTAEVGDWVVGTGSAAYGLQGQLVYAMNVSEKLSFEQYWADTRFLAKRPYLHGSIKQTRGDNIYHRHAKTGVWIGVDSRHSNDNGSPNPDHIARDTRYPFVLIADEFYYWGGSGPMIPTTFRNWESNDLVQSARNYKYKFPPPMIATVVNWIRSAHEFRFISEPSEFS
ncbi:MAG: hypothetical protein SGI77_10510 [Pirellulaceae bacterium]|nr:hypothetical protein [Pirellulaceae bacterium]